MERQRERHMATGREDLEVEDLEGEGEGQTCGYRELKQSKSISAFVKFFGPRAGLVWIGRLLVVYGSDIRTKLSTFQFIFVSCYRLVRKSDDVFSKKYLFFSFFCNFFFPYLLTYRLKTALLSTCNL